MPEKNKKFKKHLKIIIGVLLFALIFGGGLLAGNFLFNKNNKGENANQQTEEVAQNPYKDFLFEVYDIIQENYWNKISDEELTNIYKLATEKLTQAPQNIDPLNKDGIENMILPI